MYRCYVVLCVLSAILFTSVLTLPTLNITCQRKECGCVFSNGSAVNLLSLSKITRPPRFRGIPGEDGALYFFDPCTPFSIGRENETCHRVVACASLPNPGGLYDDVHIGLGEKSTATFILRENMLAIHYIMTKKETFSSVVNLVCDPYATNATMTALGLASSGIYEFNLTSICACPDLCTNNGPVPRAAPIGPAAPTNEPEEELSVGSVLVITFFSAVIFYFLEGYLYNRFCRGATGIETIPNLSFWLDLPSLVQDGCKFTWRQLGYLYHRM